MLSVWFSPGRHIFHPPFERLFMESSANRISGTAPNAIEPKLRPSILSQMDSGRQNHVRANVRVGRALTDVYARQSATEASPSTWNLLLYRNYERFVCSSVVYYCVTLRRLTLRALFGDSCLAVGLFVPDGPPTLRHDERAHATEHERASNYARRQTQDSVNKHKHAKIRTNTNMYRRARKRKKCGAIQTRTIANVV